MHPRRAVALLSALVLPLLAATAVSSASGSASAAPAHPAAVVGGTDLGPNVYLFTPDMPQSQIQSTVDTIAAQQVGNQFGDQRYALLFAPGTYGSAADPLIFQVGYYTDVMGLGQSPTDVTINGQIDVYNQCDDTGQNCTALDNFWRSLSNLTINASGDTGCRANTEFWATSQAASMRRVNVDGKTTLMDYCTNGPQYASGGFIADSAFTGDPATQSNQLINGSQQQFVVRNSTIDTWSNGVWNQVFVGDNGAPAETFGQSGKDPYTTVASAPATQEKPFLYLNGEGRARVFVPGYRANSTGPSWSGGSTAGTSLPLSSFFVASPSNTATDINRALERGQNLLLTPGVYHLTSTIRVRNANTVVLGLGVPTLTPQNGIVAMSVAGVPGVKISDVIFDAGETSSPTLLDMAPSTQTITSSPSLLQDVYFRIGGAHVGRVDTAATIGTSNVIIDNVWSWRADHGTGVGWTVNTAKTGLLVNGSDVTAYGLFVEHYQGDQVIWNGARGKIFMFQNEMPYDVPSQSAWMANATFKGHPAIRVSDSATGFRGYGLGSYSFFNQGVDIHATQAFSVARNADAQVHDVLTVFLNGSGGIDSVIDGRGAAVNAANPGPVDVVS